MKNTSKILRAVCREIDQIANRIDNGQIKPAEKAVMGHVMMEFGKHLITQWKLDRMDLGGGNWREDILSGIDTDAIIMQTQSNIEEARDD